MSNTAMIADSATGIVPAHTDDLQLVALWLHGRPIGTQAGCRVDVGRFLSFVGVPLQAVMLLAVMLSHVQARIDTLAALASTAVVAMEEDPRNHVFLTLLYVAGILAVIFPSFLRYATSHVIQRGAALPLVQQPLGHTNLGTTGRYTRINPTDSIGNYLPV